VGSDANLSPLKELTKAGLAVLLYTDFSIGAALDRSQSRGRATSWVAKWVEQPLELEPWRRRRRQPNVTSLSNLTHVITMHVCKTVAQPLRNHLYKRNDYECETQCQDQTVAAI
jgi:hypothetical protein